MARRSIHVLRRSTSPQRRIRTAAARALCALIAAAIVTVGHGWPQAATEALAQTASVFQATLMEPNQKTPEVSTEELRRILDDGSAVVFDSRPHLEYAVSHIPGALNVAPKPGVPVSVYVSDVAEIGRIVPDTATPIILYCNGPFCGKSKRLAEELLEAGYADVRRYQLGAPVWRALVGVMQIEPDGVRYVRDGDRTAVFIDARSAEEFGMGSLAGARNVPLAEVGRAKDDGRLPMEDHNTRIIVFGTDAAQARAVTAELAKNAFHNVAYFAGTLDDLLAGLGEAAVATANAGTDR
ncbi:MAG: rhodanese-like domain-containing protein [Chloroflexota bacterium]|nr:rhodanese-like domain-containing protein [Chloroflexota bacterium]